MIIPVLIVKNSVCKTSKDLTVNYVKEDDTLCLFHNTKRMNYLELTEIKLYHYIINDDVLISHRVSQTNRCPDVAKSTCKHHRTYMSLFQTL